MSKSIPKLRFKEFKERWLNKKLSDVSDFLDGKRKPIKESERAKMRGSYPYYGASGIIDYVNDFLFDEEIILLGEDGENILSRNLPLAFKVTGKCWVNNHAHVIKPIEDTDIDFLTHSLERTNYEKYNTGTAQPKLNQEVCRNITFHFPSLPEQQKIASFLGAVDEKIQQLTRKKELLEQYKKGVMQQLFSSSELGLQGLKDDRIGTKENNLSIQNSYKSQFRQLRFKDENGKPYPKWEEKRLDEVCEINPSTDELPESFIYVDLESVVKGQLIQEKRISKDEAPSRAQRKLQPRDILYQTVRPYQMNNYLFEKKGEYVASTGYAQIRTNQNTKYIYQLLHSEDFVNEVMERCTGTSFPAINSKDLGKIKVPIPHKEEQQKIASFLTALDAKIESVAAQIAHTQTFKKGLLQLMFI